MRIDLSSVVRLAGRVTGLSMLVVGALAAQSNGAAKAKPTAKLKGAEVAAPLVGAWAGTATVPLKDSSIVVPVMYTFTQTGGAIGGVAMVPGQGTGPISNVVRSGAKLQFRVTAPEGKLLEHDGNFGADGAIEGLVNLDKLPVAKFRITLKPNVPPGK